MKTGSTISFKNEEEHVKYHKMQRELNFSTFSSFAKVAINEYYKRHKIENNGKQN